MMTLFSNYPGYESNTIEFFLTHAKEASFAQLACPFFTTSEPINILSRAGCAAIRLIVRLCEATSYDALKEAMRIPGVEIRYIYPGEWFHAKFYIVGDIILIGSANMTTNGMQENIELSTTIDSENPDYYETAEIFENLWAIAAPLTLEALETFGIWLDQLPRRETPPIVGLPTVRPPTGESEDLDEREFSRFRVDYENIIKMHKLLEKIYFATGLIPSP